MCRYIMMMMTTSHPDRARENKESEELKSKE